MLRRLAILIIIFVWPYIANADVIITNEKTPLELITLVRTDINDDSKLDSILESLNALLLYPTHEYTQEASELIGMVYERLGKVERAKAEYASYLAIYPDSDSARKIRERLIALEIANPPKVINRLQKKTPRVGSDTKISGSMSEYLYTGSASTSPFNWADPQYSLISNYNMTGVFNRDEYRTKFTYRYTNLRNFTNPDSSRSRISVASVDVEDTYRDYSVRLGRQSSTTVGRFDGVRVKYGITEENDLSLEIGEPYTGTTNSNRKFYSINLGLNTFSSISTNLYYIHQVADGIIERSSVGTDVRYYKNDVSFMAIAEYDMLYKALNSIMFQANINKDPYTYYFLADRRKSPMLYADKALELGFGTTSRVPFATVGELVSNSGLTTADIYRYISESTPTSESYVAGIGKRLNNTWSIFSDIQMTNISPTYITSMPTLDIPPASLNRPGSGNSYSVNSRLSATNLFTKADSLDLIMSETKDNLSTSSAMTVSTGRTIDNIHIDILGRHFTRNQSPTHMSIDTAMVRMTGKLSDKISIDSQISIDHTKIKNPPQSQSSLYNRTIFVGMRYDF